MKIAGRKNDGAWYRVNKWLRNPGTAQILAQISLDTELIEAYDLVVGALTDMSTRASVPLGALWSGGAVPSAADLLSFHLSTGIPRTVYMGKLAWDVYSIVEPGEPFPRQYYAAKAPGFGWVISEKVEGGVGMDAARTNDTQANVYAPRNAAAFAAAGTVIRDRLKSMMLTARAGRDVFNTGFAHEGNPGGIADAQDDAVPA